MFFKKEEFANPTAENPLMLEGLEGNEPIFFYDTYAVSDGETYPYENLHFIWYNADKRVVNGYTTVHIVKCIFFFFNNENLFFPTGDLDFDQTIILDFKKGLLPVGNKWVHKLNFVYSYLQQYTYEQRLARYVNFFMKDDFVYLNEDTKLFNNGDVVQEGKLIGNIKTAYEQKKFFYGDNFSSLKNSYFNPYDFGIYLSDGFLGFGKKSWRMAMCLNKDVIDFFLPLLLKNGKFV